MLPCRVVAAIELEADKISDSVSSRKQKKSSSQNTNTASTMKRNFLGREFMRNSTYGVIEAQAVSLLPRIEVHLRISFLASRLNVGDHHIIVF